MYWLYLLNYTSDGRHFCEMYWAQELCQRFLLNAHQFIMLMSGTERRKFDSYIFILYLFEHCKWVRIYSTLQALRRIFLRPIFQKALIHNAGVVLPEVIPTPKTLHRTVLFSLFNFISKTYGATFLFFVNRLKPPNFTFMWTGPAKKGQLRDYRAYEYTVNQNN
jgi:hypothetical protein